MSVCYTLYVYYRGADHFFICDRISLYISSWPYSHNPLASAASQVLGLQANGTMPSSVIVILLMTVTVMYVSAYRA